MDGERRSISGFDPAALAKIPEALATAVTSGALSGFVTLTWRKGEVVQVNTLGLADIEAQRPMRRDTLFRIASMTKPVTSVAALMLLEEGKIALTDPITRWLPEFKDMRVLKNPDGPVDDTYSAPREVTIEDLMTHRSGLSYDFTAAEPLAKAYRAALGDLRTGDMPSDEWLKALASLPLAYPPGQQFHYSLSTDVLGFLIGRVEGMEFREVLMQRILRPLGMADTDFYIPAEKRDRAALVYRLDETGVLAPLGFPKRDGPPAFCGGGGGLVSTADDYLKFARMLLNEGEVDGVRLLRPETVRTMRDNRLTDAQRAISFLGLPMWMSQGFGLGVSMITDAEKHVWIGAGSDGSFSWPGAFGTWWQADPVEDVILIYMIQNSTPMTADLAAQAVTGLGMSARSSLPKFQKMTYAALGK